MKNARDEFAKELNGEWNSDFWKAACGCLAGVSGSAERLSGLPDTGSLDKEQRGNAEAFVWSLLALRKDPVWKQKAAGLVRENGRMDDAILEYIVALEDPELTGQLRSRLGRLRAENPGTEVDIMMNGFAIGNIEGAFVRQALGRLPVR